MWTEPLKNRNCLLMLDFDGTLVPIASHPDAIEIPDNLPQVLKQLESSGHHVVIVTGRNSAFIHEKLHPLNMPVVGLYGLEWPGEELGDKHPSLRSTLAELTALESRYDQLLVENKGHTIAVHYRNVEASKQPNARESAKQIMERVIQESHVSGLPDLSIIEGHAVVELRPAEASKRFAVKRLMQQHPELYPIYIGDDITDEEAFEVVSPVGTTVRVGPEGTSTKAKHLVKSEQDVLTSLRNALPPS